MADSSDHDPIEAENGAGPGQQVPHSESAPFHNQFEYLSQSQPQSPQVANQYGQMPFDMGALAGALPLNAQGSMTGRPQFVGDAGQMMPQGYHGSHPSGFQMQRNPSFPTQPQQQYAHLQYGSGPHSMANMPRQPGYPLQTQIPYSPIDPYGYGFNVAQFSPIDPRYGGQAPFAIPGNIPSDLSSFGRRASTDTSPVPNFPRGPPRKPKQSGHALWVGNLPPGARVTDLKDHFSREATDDIESVFLIAKSSCAFVNYRSEAACVAAMHRFHDSRFQNVRLVCRLRRGTTASPSAAAPDDNSEAPSAEQNSTPKESAEDLQSPTIARSPLDQDAQSTDDTEAPSDPDAKVQDKFFIVKSLTAQDLEASVRNGIWATQSHNEETLNKAYEQAENVYLIFSANKSGEYFGYARMASLISGEPVNLSTPAAAEDPNNPTEVPNSPTAGVGAPQSIPTPATATAPRGRIIDDSARGTIFWEADRAETSDETGPSSQDGGQDNWGRQFQIEWKSTTRLPFYRTRGLRNPWNANREVKIARDGTEIEPSVGRRLVQMFNRSAAASMTGPSGSATGGGYAQQQS